MMIPDVNCSGVAGVVGVFITRDAFPVQTPFTEITSPVCTSEKLMFPLLLRLCILINTPFRKSSVVTCPMPLVKVKATFTVWEWGASAATRELEVSSGSAVLDLVVMVLVFVEGVDLALDAGFLFFALLAMGWCLLI